MKNSDAVTKLVLSVTLFIYFTCLDFSSKLKIKILFYATHPVHGRCVWVEYATCFLFSCLFKNTAIGIQEIYGVSVFLEYNNNLSTIWCAYFCWGFVCSCWRYVAVVVLPERSRSGKERWKNTVS